MKSKKQTSKKPMSFKVAVESTPDIKNCFETGLRALGTHRTKVRLSNNSMCEGSVDIDSNVANRYPQSNRWDYAFSYKSKVYFVEVHSAYTGEVRIVKRKLQWLKDWLVSNAPELNALKAKDKGPFFWIQTNGFHIPPTSPQHREVSQAGIKPIAVLQLD